MTGAAPYQNPAAREQRPQLMGYAGTSGFNGNLWGEFGKGLLPRSKSRKKSTFPVSGLTAGKPVSASIGDSGLKAG